MSMPGSCKSPYFPNMKEDLDNIAMAPPNNIGPCNIRRDFRCLNINAASPGYLAAAADAIWAQYSGKFPATAAQRSPWLLPLR